MRNPLGNFSHVPFTWTFTVSGGAAVAGVVLTGMGKI